MLYGFDKESDSFLSDVNLPEVKELEVTDSDGSRECPADSRAWGESFNALVTSSPKEMAQICQDVTPSPRESNQAISASPGELRQTDSDSPSPSPTCQGHSFKPESARVAPSFQGSNHASSVFYSGFTQSVNQDSPSLSLTCRGHGSFEPETVRLSCQQTQEALSDCELMKRAYEEFIDNHSNLVAPRAVSVSSRKTHWSNSHSAVDDKAVDVFKAARDAELPEVEESVVTKASTSVSTDRLSTSWQSLVAGQLRGAEAVSPIRFGTSITGGQWASGTGHQEAMHSVRLDEQTHRESPPRSDSSRGNYPEQLVVGRDDDESDEELREALRDVTSLFMSHTKGDPFFLDTDDTDSGMEPTR